MNEPSERTVSQQTFSYYDLAVPEGDGPWPLLVATHGYGGDKASMMRAARRIDASRFVVASLQGSHEHVVRPDDASQPLGYGFGWLTNFRPERSIALHHRAVDAIVDELSSEGIADPARVFLLGFSQSVALNFRYAFTRPDRVRGVVAICGGIPGDWKDEGKYRAGDVDVLCVAGRDDEFYPPDRVERAAEALRSRARSVDLRFFDVGHVVPRDANPVIAEWLYART